MVFECSDQRVIDEDKEDRRKWTALFDATADMNVGCWAESGVCDNMTEEASNRINEPFWKPLGHEDFKNEVMVYGIKSLSIVSHQDKIFLVRTPFCIKVLVKIS